LEHLQTYFFTALYILICIVPSCKDLTRKQRELKHWKELPHSYFFLGT